MNANGTTWLFKAVLVAAIAGRCSLAPAQTDVGQVDGTPGSGLRAEDIKRLPGDRGFSWTMGRGHAALGLMDVVGRAHGFDGGAGNATPTLAERIELFAKDLHVDLERSRRRDEPLPVVLPRSRGLYLSVRSEDWLGRDYASPFSAWEMHLRLERGLVGPGLIPLTPPGFPLPWPGEPTTTRCRMAKQGC